ncbi:MAG: hypothetical protein ACO26U_09125 [Burkholderiaceae bacterium]
METGNIITRINRVLARDEQVLRSARNENQRQELGEFFIVDLRFNSLEAAHINLGTLAEELGVEA